MGKALSKNLQNDLVAVIKAALGDGEPTVQTESNEVTVSVLVDKMVFGEIRVEFQDFEEGHWEVFQSVALWNTRLSAFKVEEVTKTMIDVSARVRNAEAAAASFLRRLPGTRVSSEFTPISV